MLMPLGFPRVGLVRGDGGVVVLGTDDCRCVRQQRGCFVPFFGALLGRQQVSSAGDGRYRQFSSGSPRIRLQVQTCPHRFLSPARHSHNISYIPDTP